MYNMYHSISNSIEDYKLNHDTKIFMDIYNMYHVISRI